MRRRRVPLLQPQSPPLTPRQHVRLTRVRRLFQGYFTGYFTRDQGAVARACSVVAAFWSEAEALTALVGSTSSGCLFRGSARGHLRRISSRRSAGANACWQS